MRPLIKAAGVPQAWRSLFDHTLFLLPPLGRPASLIRFPSVHVRPSVLAAGIEPELLLAALRVFSLLFSETVLVLET